jgi:outer membrane protein TolC
MNALERSVAASRRSLSLAIRLYKDGLRDFQSVLDAQRSLFDQENKLAESQGNIAINLVQLYRVLGGGWEPREQIEMESAPKAIPRLHIN